MCNESATVDDVPTSFLSNVSQSECIAKPVVVFFTFEGTQLLKKFFCGHHCNLLSCETLCEASLLHVVQTLLAPHSTL